MRIFLLALSPLLAADLAGAAIKEPMLSENPTLGAQRALGAASEDAQSELFGAYARYAAIVTKRIEEDWYSGLLSDEIVDRSQKNPLPARQLEAAIAKREAELNSIKEELKNAPDGQTRKDLKGLSKAKNAQLRALRRAARRAKGTCLDWSDQVWAELSAMDLEHWTITDETREARPFHTAAVACTPPDEPKLCLAFDPWESGRAEVYEFNSWNEGSFESRIPINFFLHQLPERPRR